MPQARRAFSCRETGEPSPPAPGGRDAARPPCVSERWACRTLGQYRFTQRREPTVADDDLVLRARLREISADRPRWGYRRAGGLLAQEGWITNRKRVQRLWREEGLRVPARSRKRPRREGGPDGALRATRPMRCGR